MVGLGTFVCRQIPDDLDFLITEGHLERHIRRMRNLYDQRRQALVQSLSQHFQHQIKIVGENAGMHVMIQISTLNYWLPTGRQSRQVRRCSDRAAIH